MILLHPGRGAKARAATASHTGSLVGDHGAMLTNVANAGVLVVDTLDELVDVAELLTRYLEADKFRMKVLPYNEPLEIGHITYLHGHCDDGRLDNLVCNRV